MAPSYKTSHDKKVNSHVNWLSPEEVATESSYRRETREIFYEHALIMLAARLCAADRPLNQKERDTFSALFPARKVSKNAVGALMDAAAQEPLNLAHYLLKFKQFFPGKDKLYQRMMRALFRLAIADGPINPQELTTLYFIHSALRDQDKAFLYTFRNLVVPNVANPYAVLNYHEEMRAEELERAFILAYREYQPEHFQHVPLATDVKVIINTRRKIIEYAYARLEREAERYVV